MSFSLYGKDMFGQDVVPIANHLTSDFVVMPCSVLDARQGFWQDRKRQWLSYGIQSEVGREAVLGLQSASSLLKKISDSEDTDSTFDKGVSIFDPVICELAYRWFCPRGGIVLDPFAGGSVRGAVAQYLGNRYIGIELRKEQVDANIAQAKEMFAGSGTRPLWLNGDSNQILCSTDEPYADLLFTCPPYFDLEKYCDDPLDLSNMEWNKFQEVYSDIVYKSVNNLKPNRFAVIVIGNVRDKQGMMRDLVGTTIKSFSNAGASYYNDAIIVTPVGTVSVRARPTFQSARKLTKAHQYMLVFIKGDPKQATLNIKAKLGE